MKNPVLHKILNKAAEDKYLCNVVVDEAHIIPDWGVFFRPDFQIFSIVLRKWRTGSKDYLRTYLLSATLSDDVVDTLFTLFGIRRERAANYNYSKKGTRNLYVAVDSAVTSMRNCEEPNESWKDELNKD